MIILENTLRSSQVDLSVECTNELDYQYNVENVENEQEEENYFPKRDFYDLNTFDEFDIMLKMMKD